MIPESADPLSLDLVFGAGSHGETPEARAASSRVCFVRSQVQIAPASEHATGRRLSAAEALASFGWDALLTAATEGSFPFVTDSKEPAATLQARRETLGLTPSQVARAVGVEVAAVANAEVPGRRMPIRVLEMIAQALALDERVLGYVPNARGDRTLGVRLRELTAQKDATSFSASTVVGLSEAAWVIARQKALSAALGNVRHSLTSEKHQTDPNYGYPSWERGYYLARQTRRSLGLGIEPISSVRQLMEDVLGIPLVQLSLNGSFAGATLASEASRGVVINEKGANANVRFRRMTLCHELGHLLWDPDQRLERLTVDDYSGIQRDYREVKDPVEIRANAFAVAFLAPPEGVKGLAAKAGDTDGAVEAVMSTYGISLSAAKHHVRNVTGIGTDGVKPVDVSDDEWITAENLTVDFFPIHETPISRRGRFANVVVRSYLEGSMSSDTASMMLRCSAAEFEKRADAVADVTTPAS